MPIRPDDRRGTGRIRIHDLIGAPPSQVVLAEELDHFIYRGAFGHDFIDESPPVLDARLFGARVHLGKLERIVIKKQTTVVHAALYSVGIEAHIDIAVFSIFLGVKPDPGIRRVQVLVISGQDSPIFRGVEDRAGEHGNRGQTKHRHDRPEDAFSHWVLPLVSNRVSSSSLSQPGRL